MTTSITVRDIDPGYNSWLSGEAPQVAVTVEKLVRRLIHEKCARTVRRPTGLLRAVTLHEPGGGNESADRRADLPGCPA